MLVYRVIYTVQRVRLFFGLATPPPGVRITTLAGLLGAITRSRASRRAAPEPTTKHG